METKVQSLIAEIEALSEAERQALAQEVLPLLLTTRAGLAGRHAEFSPELRARGGRVDFGEDGFGDEQDELVGAPRLVEPSREALGAGEGAPEEPLRVKNDRERGQRGAPRR